MNGTHVPTNEELAVEINKRIEAAVVAHTLDQGEPWKKHLWDVRIPEEQFYIFRRYHEYEHLPSRKARSGGNELEQVVSLPKWNVRNGGKITDVQIVRSSDLYMTMLQEAMKSAYLPQVKQMLAHQNLLKAYKDFLDEENK